MFHGECLGNAAPREDARALRDCGAPPAKRAPAPAFCPPASWLRPRAQRPQPAEHARHRSLPELPPVQRRACAFLDEPAQRLVDDLLNRRVTEPLEGLQRAKIVGADRKLSQFCR
ncbi:hypothetical protein D9M72_561860 [compost metagenome]